eukprot:853808-Karenia_brevis.AAC.1
MATHKAQWDKYKYIYTLQMNTISRRPCARMGSGRQREDPGRYITGHTDTVCPVIVFRDVGLGKNQVVNSRHANIAI